MNQLPSVSSLDSGQNGQGQNGQNRKHIGMFRAALAQAGAHEAAPRRAAQTLLHQQHPPLVVRTQGNKRLHLGSLFPSFQRRTDAGRNGHTAAAFGQPTQAPRTAPRPRLSLSWNRKGLLRTMLPERKHRKSTRRLSLTSSSSTSTKSTSRFKREQYQTCLDIAER